MAGSEGVGQTDLLTGWSCVVHQPSEDPEPSELPSTVDITAFSSGIGQEPISNANDDNSTDSESETDSESNNSGSDVTGSCSQSESTDSDSSSSSVASSSSSQPEFSVTSSQTNGLRLTIAPVRKTCNTPTEKVVKNVTTNSKATDKSLNAIDKQGSCNLSSSSSRSDDTGSEENDESELEEKSDNNISNKSLVKKNNDSKLAKKPVTNNNKVKTRLQEKKCDSTKKKEHLSPKNLRKMKQRRKKMASLPLSRGSTCTSSDSEDSDADSAMLASCSLQEIRQEDLAAILPDQQECDGFDGFEKNTTQATGDASGSDMELPQQAVNALIQRTNESSSDSESPHPPLNPNTLCANSLLQQFVEQTQMLNAPAVNSSQSSSQNTETKQGTSGNERGDKNGKTSSNKDFMKRKRGRPRKLENVVQTKSPTKPLLNGEYSGDPDVSPDSGIQNSPDHRVSSPDLSPLRNGKVNGKNEKSFNERKKKDMKKVANVSNNAKLKNQINKIPVTANKYDRVLYANTDRVLYPPRRKGRPPSIRKGPGRPPKSHKSPSQCVDLKKDDENALKSKKLKRNVCDNKQSNLISKAKENKKPSNKSSLLLELCEHVGKRLEINSKLANKKENNNNNSDKRAKTTLKAKTKLDRSKAKYATLKNAKLMHSKHKHKKHKKCKFKILKPAMSSLNPDPKINTEIEKLIIDFMKLCNITNTSNNSKINKENVPEVLKALKKVSKKRKNSEISERKKKKQNVITVVDKETNNEQRLPLKKRHYHLSNSEDKEVEEDVEIVNNKSVDKVIKTLVSTANSKTPPSPKIAAGINNNDYEINAIDCHIDEAIEACINRYSNKNKLIDDKEKETKPENSLTIMTTATTPKKRHRLETTTAAVSETEESSKEDVIGDSNKSPLDNVVSELKMKRNLTSKFIEQKRPDSSLNSTAQMMTRKKNRLEDLTFNLVSKMSNSETQATSQTDTVNNKRKKTVYEEDPINSVRASVIKSPPIKKPKPENHITEIAKESQEDSKEISGIFTPTVDLELATIDSDKDANDTKNIIKSETAVLSLQSAPTESVVKKRVKKRRAINRTGFPTIKKKKKKVIVTVQQQRACPQTQPNAAVEINRNTDDRVPRPGEEYSTFLERTEKVPLEKTFSITSAEDIGKWEDMSECDSLPQEERIEFEPMQETDSKVKIEGNNSQDLDEISLESRIARLRKKKDQKMCEKVSAFKKFEERHLMTRKKLRDVSPASSIENTYEKRIKEEYSLSGDEARRVRKAPRWRKKYLVAGLFSDYYKEDDETARQRRQENITSKARIVYNPEDHPYGLLPPPYHCGKYLRCRKIPFQLPYDLWWQHSHSQLPGRDIVPSWNYRKIRTNVYNVKTTTGACEPQSCNCSTTGCGDDCINRLVLAECPASHKCQNQRIQKHEWAPNLEKFMTENKGWGVRTNLPIKHGEFILEYVGEVVSDHEFKERMATRYINDTHHYCLHLDGGLVIDGHRMGGDGRFVNHSCQPNCEMQKWTVNGQFRMALFALRDISAGEELTYDYNFSLFNPAEGQQCMCGSENCRGVIGGKSQRVRPQIPNVVNGRVGRPRKNLAKRTHNNGTSKESSIPPISAAVLPVPPIKPLSNTQRTYILEHHCFLLRNLNKVKKLREKPITSVTTSRQQTATPTDNTAAFLSHLNALQKPRNMKTRRLAQAEDDPELKKAAKLASLLKDLWKSIIDAKDETGAQLCLPLLNIPSKRKVPEYYQRITNPIDLSIIEQNITSGAYKTAENFDDDMSRLFANTIRFYGRTSEPGIASTRLKKIYSDVKQEASNKFEDELGVKPPAAFTTKKIKSDEEDVIRCICGMYRDEGLMIQCERCMVWQHCECVQADASTPSYHCEKCVAREVDYEIPMNEYTEHGHQYYMTLLRGNLQLRQGDTVYVLRDITIPGTNKKHTYETIGQIEFTDLDIFRIERLWKDKENGQRFAYGHHYLRPHETYHEPTRKFFPNEVMRVPLYEAVPVELIIRHCWVLDLNTYCKGRPIEATEEHIYICEYRVDKTARLFSKVSKSKFPICTKSYAFEKFDIRLKVSRTYTPHDLNPAFIKPRGRKPQENEDIREITSIPVPVPVRTRDEQKARLNKILLNLLSKLPTKQVLDVSYLLEAGRRRKKPI